MELNQCINYLLTTSQHKVFQEISRRLEPFDVTPIQYGVMHCLWKGEKTTPKEIASELKLENSTISGILDRMEKKGLLNRHVSVEDRRYIEVVLTEKGKSLEEPILKIIDEANHDIMIDIPEDEQEILKKNLRLLAGL
ncbi:MAG: MarR family winged helix-turn-helix transcriptional regulator [Coprococcus sp.]